MVKSNVLVTAMGIAGVFVSAGVKAAHWRVDPDGATLRLHRTDGLTVIFR